MATQGTSPSKNENVGGNVNVNLPCPVLRVPMKRRAGSYQLYFVMTDMSKSRMDQHSHQFVDEMGSDLDPHQDLLQGCGDGNLEELCNTSTSTSISINRKGNIEDSTSKAKQEYQSIDAYLESRMDMDVVGNHHVHAPMDREPVASSLKRDQNAEATSGLGSDVTDAAKGEGECEGESESDELGNKLVEIDADTDVEVGVEQHIFAPPGTFPFEQMPEDFQIQALAYLSKRDYLTCKLVCKRWDSLRHRVAVTRSRILLRTSQLELSTPMIQNPTANPTANATATSNADTDKNANTNANANGGNVETDDEVCRSAAALRSKDIDANPNETTNDTDMNDLTVNPETNTNIESDPIIRETITVSNDSDNDLDRSSMEIVCSESHTAQSNGCTNDDKNIHSSALECIS